jgi:hypothetical protein
MPENRRRGGKGKALLFVTRAGNAPRRLQRKTLQAATTAASIQGAATARSGNGRRRRSTSYIIVLPGDSIAKLQSRQGIAKLRILFIVAEPKTQVYASPKLIHVLICQAPGSGACGGGGGGPLHE